MIDEDDKIPTLRERVEEAILGTKDFRTQPERRAGVKLDEGKARFDLLPPDALLQVTRVYTFGAKKYAARNWENGMDWGRVYAAQQRHMNAFWGGEMYDPETGLMHTAHAAFGALTLCAYSLRGIGTDTRTSPEIDPRAWSPDRGG